MALFCCSFQENGVIELGFCEKIQGFGLLPHGEPPPFGRAGKALAGPRAAAPACQDHNIEHWIFCHDPLPYVNIGKLNIKFLETLPLYFSYKFFCNPSSVLISICIFILILVLDLFESIRLRVCKV